MMIDSRPEGGLAVGAPSAPTTTPTITIAHHRFSASTPDLSEEAGFRNSQVLGSTSERTPTDPTDFDILPEPSHLRRRSMPQGAANLGGSSTARSSMQTVKEALAARHIHKNSFTGLSILESEAELPTEKPRDLNRPFSLSNTYPFVTSQNRFSNANSKIVAVDASPNPSSRFSSDEKKDFQTTSENNDFQSSAWNLFGRSPGYSSMLKPAEARNKASNTTMGAHASTAKRRKRRFLVLFLLFMLIATLAGAAAGIGVWRNNAAKAGTKLDATAADHANDANDTGNSDVSAAGSATATSASPASSQAPAVSGSGGAGGYNTIVTFGSSYSGKWVSA